MGIDVVWGVSLTVDGTFRPCWVFKCVFMLLPHVALATLRSLNQQQQHCHCFRPKTYSFPVELYSFNTVVVHIRSTTGSTTSSVSAVPVSGYTFVNF